MTDGSMKYLENLSELVVITDRNYACRFVNPAYCRVFGGDPKDWTGQIMGFADGDCEIVPGIDGDETSVARFESRSENNGKTTWIEWQQTDQPDGDRLFVGRDVTRRKIEGDSLRTAAQNAEAGSETKMRFLATMSHEMRTPLNGILGMTGLLLDSGLDANQKAYADAIRESGTALLALINDILDYSKIDAGKIDLEETVFDPLSLVQSVTELLSPRAAHKGLEIASYVDPSVPQRLIGDEARLRQVLLNLAGNGVKFTDDGGVTIEVNTEQCQSGVAHIRIDVRDSGVGISGQDLPLIFDEFAQADSTHARKFEGTGLGLAIARRIVQAMGGTMTAESTLGEGSTFSFSVPLKIATGRNNTRKEYKISDPVIMITTSDTLKRIVTLQLQTARVKNFCITSSPEETFSFLRKHRNAILLCDLAFAAQYGEKLAKAASHALVLLSPVARGRLESFRRVGFQGYLIKPMRQSSLFERLSERDLPPQKTQRLDSMATAPNAGPKKFRVLLAEDNQINAVLATAIIKRAGHHVDVAGNGLEALDAVQAAPYDLVLMDMHMPEMDGLTAARQIRELPGEVGEIPIVALTANAMQSDRETCISAGMDDFLTKPFDPLDLTGLIDQWGHGRKADQKTTTAEAG